MNLSKLTKITRVIICSAAIALGVVAWFQNRGHLITAAALFAVGLNVEWVKNDDVL